MQIFERGYFCCRWSGDARVTLSFIHGATSATAEDVDLHIFESDRTRTCPMLLPMQQLVSLAVLHANDGLQRRHLLQSVLLILSLGCRATEGLRLGRESRSRRTNVLSIDVWHGRLVDNGMITVLRRAIAL